MRCLFSGSLCALAFNLLSNMAAVAGADEIVVPGLLDIELANVRRSRF